MTTRKTKALTLLIVALGGVSLYAAQGPRMEARRLVGVWTYTSSTGMEGILTLNANGTFTDRRRIPSLTENTGWGPWTNVVGTWKLWVQDKENKTVLRLYHKGWGEFEPGYWSYTFRGAPPVWTLPLEGLQTGGSTVVLERMR